MQLQIYFFRFILVYLNIHFIPLKPLIHFYYLQGLDNSTGSHNIDKVQAVFETGQVNIYTSIDDLLLKKSIYP